MLIFCAVGPMTAQTIERQVGIARNGDILTDRVGRVSLPVMALGTGLGNGFFLLEEEIIRGVWRVTNRTIPIADRLMLRLGTLLAGHGIGVTTATNVLHRLSQQTRL